MPKMTSELVPTKPAEVRTTPKPSKVALKPSWKGNLGLLCLFLSLVFLLGIFPNKDTDLWWHLRTGQIIRATGTVPTTDLYTWTAADHKWIDLHWGFQILASLVYEQGGVPLLNLVKCSITTLALLLLITAKKPDWPLWSMILAWIPALLVLSGRMYIRPETMTLLFLAAELAVLFRWETRPRLAYLLPLIQLFWVNSHGLFVLGPVTVAAALLDALVRPGSFTKSGKAWWKTVSPAIGLTGLACLVNPYGLTGTLFPLELAGTMSNPVFENIAELQSIPSLIKATGWSLPPLQIHMFTMALGALSFVVPITWLILTRLLCGPLRGKKKRKAARTEGPLWRLSPMRLSLFIAFSLLSLKASRNSHQFAAIVGTITAWNLGEFAAGFRRRRSQLNPAQRPNDTIPQIFTGLILILFLGLVSTGVWYQWMGEGRTVGVGEEPLWFPHDAVKFAGRAGMPDRVVGFHNGHTPLYAFYHGPEKKIYADARLEVIGPKVYADFNALQQKVMRKETGWEAELDKMGRPAILVDNINQGPTDVSATLLSSLHWKCVYFDPIAAVFLHDSALAKAGVTPIDFGRRHFEPDPADQPSGVPALLASARALRFIATALVTQGHNDVARPLVLLALDHARRAEQLAPTLPESSKTMGLLAWLREPWLLAPQPVKRYRSIFNPALDLDTVTSIFRLRRALESSPDDFSLMFRTIQSYQSRGMAESTLPVIDRLLKSNYGNITQATIQARFANERAKVVSELGPPVPSTWENSGELDRIVGELLDRGRVESAARMLEKAFRPESRPWSVSDQMATLWLHLGDVAKAKSIWESAPEPPSKGALLAKVAACQAIEGEVVAARRSYRDALIIEPQNFDALYGLAALELDAGNAADTVDAARQAVLLAPSDASRNAAEVIMSIARPYVKLL